MKIDHHLFNNQSLQLSSLSDIDDIIQEEEEIFKENPQYFYQKYLS